MAVRDGKDGFAEGGGLGGRGRFQTCPYLRLVAGLEGVVACREGNLLKYSYLHEQASAGLEASFYGSWRIRTQSSRPDIDVCNRT